ncbi:hypothetical protein RUND412_002250 [Rhizina undulata]
MVAGVFFRHCAGGILASVLTFIPVILAQAVTYEAEDATLNGVTVETSQTGFSGTGYVEGFDESTDTITFSISSDSQILYDIQLRYSAPFGTKTTTLSFNGGSGGDVQLPETTSWDTISAGQVLLDDGANTISIVSNWGWYYIDALLLTPSEPRPAHAVTGALVNTASSTSTKSLMAFLTANYGNKYISGQQDPVYVDWVTENVGKTPAVAGLDMIEYSPSRVEHGSTSTAVEDAIAWDAKGGIVTFCWHWNAPTGLIDTEGKEWWRGFYTDSVTFDVEAALADTTNANYTLLIRDIDAIAVQLKRLRDADVPVLWRPLHEAEGGWFWWGAKGAEPCKKLYGILYDRLTNYHNLNNLIWIWNSVAADWYPGDDTVDILSYDSYPTAGDHGPISAPYNALYELGADTKLIATSEVGSIPDPDLTQAYEADWSWFVVWGDYFITDGVYNSLDFLKRVYTSDFVLTLDEIGGWKSYGGGSGTSTTSTLVTSRTATTAAAAVTTTAAAAVAAKYGQCGGVNWTGATACESGSSCTAVSPPYYYQCL